MRLDDALNILKESQGGHVYDIWIPSLEKTVSFRPLTVGQLKSLNKFSIDDDDDNFYKALSSLIIELSDNEVKLEQINELDRVLILSEIKKNNTTTPESINVTCSECEKEFVHELDITNYDNQADISNKISEFEIENELNEETKIKCVIGLPSVYEQIAFKEYVVQSKRKKYKNELRRFNGMINMSSDQKEKLANKEANKEEQFLSSNINFLFIRHISIGDNEISNLLSENIENRLKLYDQLPGSIRGEITNNIIFKYKDMLDKFLKYSVKCPHCSAIHTEEVPISNFFII